MGTIVGNLVLPGMVLCKAASPQNTASLRLVLEVFKIPVARGSVDECGGTECAVDDTTSHSGQLIWTGMAHVAAALQVSQWARFSECVCCLFLYPGALAETMGMEATKILQHPKQRV